MRKYQNMTNDDREIVINAEGKVDLSVFYEQLSSHVCEKISTAILDYYEDNDYCDIGLGTRVSRVKSFLNWLVSEETDFYKKILHDIREIGLSSFKYDVLERIGSDYRNYLKNDKKKKDGSSLAVNTKNNYIDGINFLFKVLSKKALTHRMYKIAAFNSENLSVSKKTLVQSDFLVSELAEEANLILDGIKGFDSNNRDNEEMFSFLSVLVKNQIKPKTVDEFKHQIIKLLSIKLEEIRKCAESEILNFEIKVKSAEKLAAMSDFTTEEIEEVLCFYYQAERYSPNLPANINLYDCYRKLVFKYRQSPEGFLWKKEAFYSETLYQDIQHAKREVPRIISAINKYTSLEISIIEVRDEDNKLIGWSFYPKGDVFPEINPSFLIKDVSFKNFFGLSKKHGNKSITKEEEREIHRIGLCRLLRFVKEKFEGVIPAYYDEYHKRQNELKDPIDRALISFLHSGSRYTVEEIQSYFIPQTRVYGAFIALISIDTAINVDSLRKVLAEEVLLDAQEGWKLFKWLKPRSKRKLSHYERIETNDAVSVVKAFEILVETTKQIRCETKSKYIFETIRAYKERKNRNDKVVSSNGFLNWFKMFCDEYDQLKGQDFTIEQIRPSVLLLIALVTGDPYAVQQKAKHTGIDMAMRYANRYPMLLKYEKKMREFMHWLQAVYTVNIEDFAKKVGIDEKKYEKERKEILKRHFGGINCLLPKHKTVVDKCGNVKKCMSCEHRSNVIISSVENIVSMMQWQQRLNFAVNSSGDELPIEWRSWKIFVDSMLDRISMGSKRSSFNRATKEFNKRKNPYPSIEVLENAIKGVVSV